MRPVQGQKFQDENCIEENEQSPNVFESHVHMFNSA